MLTAGFTNHSVPDFFFYFPLSTSASDWGVKVKLCEKKKIDVDLPCMCIFKIDPQSRSQCLEDRGDSDGSVDMHKEIGQLVNQACQNCSQHTKGLW